jgi:hypothetical protein
VSTCRALPSPLPRIPAAPRPRDPDRWLRAQESPGPAEAGALWRCVPLPTRPGAVVTNGVRPGAEKKTALDGTWTSGKGGEKVALYLYRGAAALNSPGFCTGTIDASARIRLTCAKGSRARTSGHAVLRSGALVVSWQNGPKDTLHRH